VLERTRDGLREMPSNAAWLLSRVFKPTAAIGTAAESAAAGARDRGRKLGAAVVDAAPVGGDSVEIRVRRAQEAAERAQQAENRAVEAARESKALADHARQVSERGRARVKEVERETSRHVKQRVAEAQRTADEFVKHEREAAEADAEAQQEEVQEEVDSDVDEAQRDAEASQHHAEELVEDATEAQAEARRLADEAVAGARSAAEEADRQAQLLTDDAVRQASNAEARVKATEQLREHSAAAARHTARELNRETTNGGLKAYNKPELIELAASIGIERRRSITRESSSTRSRRPLAAEAPRDETPQQEERTRAAPRNGGQLVRWTQRKPDEGQAPEGGLDRRRCGRSRGRERRHLIAPAPPGGSEGRFLRLAIVRLRSG
jgi:colicin import membrane protein